MFVSYFICYDGCVVCVHVMLVFNSILGFVFQIQAIWYIFLSLVYIFKCLVYIVLKNLATLALS